MDDDIYQRSESQRRQIPRWAKVVSNLVSGTFVCIFSYSAVSGLLSLAHSAHGFVMAWGREREHAMLPWSGGVLMLRLVLL